MLVSCVMLTRDQRWFVGQAIRCFLRQDYTPKELVILDDGGDPVADLVPADERIRYRRLDTRLSVEAKRTLGCEISEGELIAHWDDDGWSAPHRLSLQVSELLAAGAEVCGARELLCYAPMSGQVWRYRRPLDERRWLAGATLLYRRSFWAAHRFTDMAVGEDSAFIRQPPSARIHALSDSSFYVALLLDGVASPKGPRWERRPPDEVSSLLAFDRDFYVALRGGPQPATSVTVGASFMVYDGYGSMAGYLVLGMARAGAKVNVVPLDLRLEGLSAQVRDLIGRSQPEVGAPALYYSWLRADLRRFRSAPDLFIHTMWESSRLPADWPAQLNQARAVIVPTRFVARVCRDSGVTVPLEVVPDGVDSGVYRFQERPERAGLTTLIVANKLPRKHIREGIAAWKIAFAGDPQARLIIKARFGRSTYALDDPRITLVVDSEASRGIVHWYREADVLLALGSEGFGLPLIEGMATGLPVIALSSEGQGDVCEEAGDLLLPVAPARWEPCDEAPFGLCGVRGVPGVEDVAARLRWVAGHRHEARDLGRAASEWVLRHRDVWEKGPAVLDVLERRARLRRPLRWARTLWVAPRTSPCGVADYTTWLAAAMPGGVRVTNQRPDIRGLRLLHVQHANRMFDDVELTRYVRQARQVAPVVITEHAVGPVARAWECEADALVALTPPGAEQLQSRWPSMAVHYLPHGCHTWFPPRKKVRGRVLGAFGFLAPHKGFWRLLDVLREVEGTELLLFSHAKSAEIQARWEAAAQGLPVRRISEALPVEEVARCLAAEADVLVFWYDEVCRHASASGAVRVGLASGVPVLTSPTCWFSDLAQVTYQPDDLVDGVRRLLEDTPFRDQLTAAARDHCHEHSWPRSAQRHLVLWEALKSV